ncbi:MAG: glycoside hydrolase family 25 protein [Mycobacterium sp.]|nr:glycoside hydrolase family 25 protein [Mycobacterium sp.]
MGQIKIIDISGYNPQFDLRAVKAAGYTGVYIKATEGTGYVNPYFAAQRQAAIDAGLVWGAYHFFHPGTNPRPRQTTSWLWRDAGYRERCLLALTSRPATT